MMSGLRLSILLGASFLLACGERTTTAAQPDVVLIVMDDMGLLIGSYGDPIAATPRIDAFASQGMRFEAAFATAPLCSPSRATLFTGLYPHSAGQTGMRRESLLRHDVATAPGYFAAAGYATALVGKRHVKGESNQLTFDSHRRLDRSRPEAAAVGEAVAGALAEASDRPIFLVVAPHAPHSPYPGELGAPAARDPVDPAALPWPAWLPDTPALRADRARLYDAHAAADAVVGAALDALAAAGRARPELVALTSDHGPALPGGKGTLFDGGLRVPLLIRWPGRVAAGGVCRALVSGVDVLPTLLAAAGREQPGLEGRSLLPWLRDPGLARDDPVFAELTGLVGGRYYPQRMVRTTRYKYLRTLRPDRELHNTAMDRWAPLLLPLWHVDRRARFLLEHDIRQPREQLYDLATDPEEHRNLAGDPEHAEVRALLREALRAWMQATDDPWLALWSHSPGRPDPLEPPSGRSPARWLADAIPAPEP